MVSILLRRVQLVPIGGRRPVSNKPIDVRITRGIVDEVGPDLTRYGEDEIDAGGRWLIPGLWDQHVHFGQWAATASRLDLTATHSADEVTSLVAQALRARAQENDAHEDGAHVLQGFGHRTAPWPRQPTVAELDAVSGATPVVLISGDAHHGWLNSAALQLLNVPARDGVVEENEWFPVFARLDEVTTTAKGKRAAYQKMQQAALAKGVVGIREMEWADNATEWAQRSERGETLLRVRTATYAAGLDEVLAAGWASGTSLDDAGLVTMGPLKIISDGSLNTRTAWCHEPYADGEDLEFPRGRANTSRDELTDLLRRAARGGLEVAVHAIGDAAVSAALDAFAVTRARGSIEHAQLVAPADVQRMGELGVAASVQPVHLLDDRDVTGVCWPDREDRCFPLRSLHEAGVTLAMGSDAPVAPLDPWLAMAAAVYRSGDERGEWNPSESLTAAQALAASVDGAHTVSQGSPGDLVLLDDNPLAGAAPAEVAARLGSMPIAATVVGGQVVYADSALER